MKNMNLDFLNKYIHPIHKDGYIFIAIFAFAALLLNSISDFLGMIGFILTIWCVYFFRNPNRFVPQKEGLVVSPSDGTIVDVCKSKPPAELDIQVDRDYMRISIYLGVFDMHIQRAPIAGIVDRVEYNPGKFLSAAEEKASDDNERNSILIKTSDDVLIPVVQIAGYISRRIVCWAGEGKKLDAGERYGMIRFGSRVDIYLPEGVAPQVGIGQKMIAGETVIADLNNDEEAIEVQEI